MIEFFEHEDVFNYIHECVNDLDALKIGIEILKIAKERLNADLNNEDIKKEYIKLGIIIEELETIEKNYV